MTPKSSHNKQKDIFDVQDFYITLTDDVFTET